MTMRLQPHYHLHPVLLLGGQKAKYNTMMWKFGAQNVPRTSPSIMLKPSHLSRVSVLDPTIYEKLRLS